MEIVEATTDADLEATRRLCWAYREGLAAIGGRDAEAVLHFYAEDAYRRLMADLPQKHAAPGGAIYLVKQDGVPMGCGMFYEFSPGVAEIKRVYLDPGLRGQGAGRRLMEVLIAACRDSGYARIVMDTGLSLEAAITLYDRLGFPRTGPYYDVPDDLREVMVFFEMDL